MIVILPVLALLAWPPAQARSEPFERIGTCFQALQLAAPARLPPTGDEIRRLLLQSARCGWVMVQEKLTPTEVAAVDALGLQVEDGDGPPARVLGTTIHVSLDGFARAMQVGQVVGHDVFVNDGYTFPVPSMVAYGPLASQPIIGLTDRLSGWIDNAASATACQEVDCKTVQGLAIFLGIDGFLLAHEAAHVLLRHGNTEAAENELAADRWAYGLVRRYDADFEGTETLQLARTAARLSPIVLLDYLRSRLMTEEGLEQSSAEIQLLVRRREQLERLAHSDDRLTLDTLRPSVDTGAGRLQIAVESAEDRSARFWIDGVLLLAPDVLAGERVVAAGVRHIAAWANGRFSYVTSVINAGERKRVALRFSVPHASVPLAELEQLAKRRKDPLGEEKWLQVFLRTTDASGAPRTPEVALLHYQAMSMMHLGRLIPDVPADVIDARALRSIRRWRESARPLSGWK